MRSTSRSDSAGGVRVDFNAFEHSSVLRLVLRTQPRSGGSVKMRPPMNESGAVQFLVNRAMKPPPLLSSIANASLRRAVVFSI